MEIIFNCPKCKRKARIQMSDEDAAAIRQRIIDEGRSPTVIVKCESDHDLLVTLYNLRNEGGLGIRDVVVPISSEPQGNDKKTSSKEVNWLAKAFGGDE